MRRLIVIDVPPGDALSSAIVIGLPIVGAPASASSCAGEEGYQLDTPFQRQERAPWAGSHILSAANRRGAHA
jgi:hypothetical protein